MCSSDLFLGAQSIAPSEYSEGLFGVHPAVLLLVPGLQWEIDMTVCVGESIETRRIVLGWVLDDILEVDRIRDVQSIELQHALIILDHSAAEFDVRP